MGACIYAYSVARGKTRPNRVTWFILSFAPPDSLDLERFAKVFDRPGGKIDLLGLHRFLAVMEQQHMLALIILTVFEILIFLSFMKSFQKSAN